MGLLPIWIVYKLNKIISKNYHSLICFKYRMLWNIWNSTQYTSEDNEIYNQYTYMVLAQIETKKWEYEKSKWENK